MHTRNIDNCNFGDIVVADLPFPDDLSQSKLRPVLILNRDGHDYLMMKISSRLNQKNDCDVVLSPDSTNSLEEESLFQIGKISMYSKEILHKKIGTLSQKDQITIKKHEKPVPNRYKYNEDWIRSKIPDELRKDIPTVRSKKQAEMFFMKKNSWECLCKKDDGSEKKVDNYIDAAKFFKKTVYYIIAVGDPSEELEKVEGLRFDNYWNALIMMWNVINRNPHIPHLKDTLSIEKIDE